MMIQTLTKIRPRPTSNTGEKLVVDLKISKTIRSRLPNCQSKVLAPQKLSASDRMVKQTYLSQKFSEEMDLAKINIHFGDFCWEMLSGDLQ